MPKLFGEIISGVMVAERLRPWASPRCAERLFSSWTLEGPLISCKCLLENALTFHVNGKTLFNRLPFIALQVSGHYTHHRGPLNLVWYYLRKSLLPSHYVHKFGLGVRGINLRPQVAENKVGKLPGRQKNQWEDLCNICILNVCMCKNFQPWIEIYCTAVHLEEI